MAKSERTRQQHPTEPGSGSPLRIRLFGSFGLACGQEPLPLPRTAAARSLLAYLLLHHGRPLPRDLLTGTFWLDRPDAEARKALSDALWQVRQCLGPAAAGRLAVEREAICLTLLPHDTLDVDSFSAPLRRHRERLQGGSLPPAALSAGLSNLDAAIALYRADLLVDCYDDWVLPERERLHEEYLWALEQLTLLAKQWGDDERALAYARRLVAADPLRETAHRELMRLYHALGRHRAALEQYASVRKILADELGVEPAAATAALYHEIQAALAEAGPVHLPAPAPALGELARLPFVGRTAERAALLEALQAAARGHGGLVLVEGAAGVGKTRLVQELVADARWRGFQVGLGRADPLAASAPYQPLVDALAPLLTPLRLAQLAALVEPLWLSATTPLLPVLREHLPDLPALAPLEPEQEQQRLWEGLARCAAGLAAVAPLLLVFEDVHWADAATLAVLSYLAHRLPGLRLLAVLTCRGAEARERAVVWDALEALDRALPLRRVPLAAFAPTESAALVQRVLGLDTADPAAQALTAALQKRSGHNALFLVEMLKAALEQGAPTAAEGWAGPDGTVALPTPASLQGLIGQRLQRLPAALRATLALAAVLGEEVSFRLLARAGSDSAAELAGHLGGLCQRGFLAETACGYRFEHEVVRDTVYGVTSSRRRQALHRQVVTALEALQPEDLEGLAHHAAAGGDRPRAARYYRLAGERAAAHYAHREAVSYFSRALEFTAEEQVEERYSLLLARERAHDLLGEREAQRRDLEALRQAASGLGHSYQAQAALRQANYAESIGDYLAAVAAAQTALGLARGNPAAAPLVGWGCFLQGWSFWRQADYQSAAEWLHQGLRAARAANDRQLEANCLRTLGIVSCCQGECDAARSYLQEARRLHRESGDLQGEANALGNLGFVSDLLGDYAGAQQYHHAALQSFRQIGDLQGEGNVLGNLGSASHFQGDYAGAQVYYGQALRISRDLGDRYLEANTLTNLGATSDLLGDYGQCRVYLEQARQRYQEIGDRRGDGLALGSLALLHYHIGDWTTALEYGRKSLGLAREIGDRYSEGYAWISIGHALAGLQDWSEAAQAYLQVLELERDLGEYHLTVTALAGLAEVAMAQGNLAAARENVEQILEYRAANQLPDSTEPYWISWVCYRVLQASSHPEAFGVLSAAYDGLQERAARMEAAEMRRSFLENVASNREIIAAYRAARENLAPTPVTARLPRAGAPTGRPLRDDERVTVAWTPALPADEQVAGKSARRQHRLRRLLGEAAAQGAAPTVTDLAAALGVDARTIKRDLAALRAAGHPTPTRGQRRSG